jgi:acid phosphatase family membrane protein YuiD
MQKVHLNFSLLFGNRIFLASLCSLVAAQLLKVIISLVRAKREGFSDSLLLFFWKTGGMPSSHSSVAVAVSTSIALTEGFTNLFILSLFFSLIVIRDSLGVRLSSGQQSKALNRLGSELSERFGIQYESVKEVLGHSWPEVTVGGLVGFLIALAFCLPRR